MENSDSLETSQLNELISKYSPFINEIRKRILYTLAVFAIATVGGFFYYETIIKFLIEILSLKGVNIVFTSPFQFVNLAVSCGLAAGVVFVFPLIIYQFLSFLRPALRAQEYKTIVRFLPFSILLFIIGFSFGFLVMRWQIELFLTKSVSLGIGNVLDISLLISTVLLISAFMGIAFQFPLAIMILTHIGIIKQHQLVKQRPWVYLGALFFTILLPLDSIIADLLLALPLVALFEVALIFNRISDRKKVAEV